MATMAGEEKDVAATIKGIGVTGSLLYTAMLVFVAWRVFGFYHTGAARSEAATGGFPARAWFHSFLLASVICDLPYFYKLVRRDGDACLCACVCVCVCARGSVSPHRDLRPLPHTYVLVKGPRP